MEASMIRTQVQFTEERLEALLAAGRRDLT